MFANAVVGCVGDRLSLVAVSLTARGSRLEDLSLHLVFVLSVYSGNNNSRIQSLWPGSASPRSQASCHLFAIGGKVVGERER